MISVVPKLLIDSGTSHCEKSTYSIVLRLLVAEIAPIARSMIVTVLFMGASSNIVVRKFILDAFESQDNQLQSESHSAFVMKIIPCSKRS